MRESLICPGDGCRSRQLVVIDSRCNTVGTTIRRRRRCLTCGHRFTTYETLDKPFSVHGLRFRIAKAVESAVEGFLADRSLEVEKGP